MRYATLWIFFFLQQCSVLSAELPENCTEFLAKKKMFFSQHAEVRGRNCAQKISYTKNSEKLHFTVTIPVEKFTSGNRKRDNALVEILGNSLTFRSEFTAANFQKLLTGEISVLAGSLELSTGTFPLVFHLTKTDKQLTGSYRGTLTAFGITPPKVGPAGAIADTEDFVELTFKIHINNLPKTF